MNFCNFKNSITRRRILRGWFYFSRILREVSIIEKISKIQNYFCNSKLELENQEMKFICSLKPPWWIDYENDCTMIGYCEIRRFQLAQDAPTWITWCIIEIVLDYGDADQDGKTDALQQTIWNRNAMLDYEKFLCAFAELHFSSFTID